MEPFWSREAQSLNPLDPELPKSARLEREREERGSKRKAIKRVRARQVLIPRRGFRGEGGVEIGS